MDDLEVGEQKVESLSVSKPSDAMSSKDVAVLMGGLAGSTVLLGLAGIGANTVYTGARSSIVNSAPEKIIKGEWPKPDINIDALAEVGSDNPESMRVIINAYETAKAIKDKAEKNIADRERLPEVKKAWEERMRRERESKISDSSILTF